MAKKEKRGSTVSLLSERVLPNVGQIWRMRCGMQVHEVGWREKVCGMSSVCQTNLTFTRTFGAQVPLV